MTTDPAVVSETANPLDRDHREQQKYDADLSRQGGGWQLSADGFWHERRRATDAEGAAIIRRPCHLMSPPTDSTPARSATRREAENDADRLCRRDAFSRKRKSADEGEERDRPLQLGIPAMLSTAATSRALGEGEMVKRGRHQRHDRPRNDAMAGMAPSPVRPETAPNRKTGRKPKTTRSSVI